MKERPILFTGDMVRALLDGSKTQTRRIMRSQPPENWRPAHYGDLNGYDKHEELTPDKVIGWGAVNDDGDEGFPCPNGKPGDRLWVREGWRTEERNDDIRPRDLRVGVPVYYEAGGGGEETIPSCAGRYRPGMFMCRWMSRITLEIVSVRVERLQDISEADARAEGVSYDPGEGGTFHVSGLAGCCCDSAVGSYRKLWDSINQSGRPTLPTNPASKRYARVKHWLETHPDTTSWAANPWVWVVEFKRITP